MSSSVKLGRLSDRLRELDYPRSKSDVAAAFDDVTLLLADGETNLGDAISGCESDRFDDADELESELYGFLPVDAVGDPGQSEGDV